VLRTDPTAAGSVFHARRTEDAWTATFGAGRGFLTYWVLEAERIVVLLDLTWAGSGETISLRWFRSPERCEVAGRHSAGPVLADSEIGGFVGGRQHPAKPGPCR
jgi:hypothetical protein